MLKVESPTVSIVNEVILHGEKYNLKTLLQTLYPNIPFDLSSLLFNESNHYGNSDFYSLSLIESNSWTDGKILIEIALLHGLGNQLGNQEKSLLPTLLHLLIDSSFDFNKRLTFHPEESFNGAIPKEIEPYFEGYKRVHQQFHLHLSLLKEGHSESQVADWESEATLLHLACLTGNDEVVKSLLQHSKSKMINPNQATFEGVTPFYTACYQRDIGVVKILLDYPNIELNVAFKGKPLLELVYELNDLFLLELLLRDDRIDPNVTTLNEMSLLSLSARDNREDVIELLLKNRKTDVNKFSSKGETSILWAARRGHAKILQMLLPYASYEALYPDIDFDSHSPKSMGFPFYEAWECKHFELLLPLLKHQFEAKELNEKAINFIKRFIPRFIPVEYIPMIDQDVLIQLLEEGFIDWFTWDFRRLNDSFQITDSSAQLGCEKPRLLDYLLKSSPKRLVKLFEHSTSYEGCSLFEYTSKIGINYLYISPEGRVEQANQRVSLCDTLILYKHLKEKCTISENSDLVLRFIQLAQERLEAQIDKPLRKIAIISDRESDESENPKIAIGDILLKAFYSSETDLILSDQHLLKIPKVIGHFLQLRTLDLSCNHLTSLPHAIWDLSQLQGLNLSSNPLNSLPSDIRKLSQLSTLNLKSNNLTSLPSAIWDLSQLQELNLSSNPLNSLPSDIRKLSQLSTLNLESNNLASLPSEIGSLSQLRELTLADNYLNPLPPAIWNLSQLRKLNLVDNKLTVLPPEIGNFSQLDTLNLSCNELASLPSAIWNLSQLRELSLQDNKLTLLPPEIGKLSQLGTLNLSSNELTSLPHAIWDLSQLRELDISFNPLDALPSEIGKLSRLRVLCLLSNGLTSLPPAIWDLSQIQELNLSSNQLRSFPSEVRKLSQLSTLNLEDNRLTVLPLEIGDLARLRTLNLSYNELISLPPAIGRLSQLRELSLRDNNLTILPSEIGNLSQLSAINLSYNELISLPPTIGGLSQLRELSLRDNNLTSLPPEIGNLSQLMELCLWDNNLTVLPREIGNLSQLSTLNLSYNNLTSLPPEIGNLSQLSTLNLSYNNLTSLPEEIEELYQLQKLYLACCGLAYLPQSVFLLPSQCSVFLESANFSRTILREIQQTIIEREYEGLQCPEISYEILSDDDMSSDESFRDFHEATEYWRQLASEIEPFSFDSLNDAEKTALLSLLTVAKLAPQAQNTLTLTLLAKRITRLLHEFINPLLEQQRPQLLALIEEATGSCGDRVELSLLQMELFIKMHRTSIEPLSAESVHPSNLPLLLGFYYWQRLKEIAHAKTIELKARSFSVDEVEIHLAYLVKLKERLHLPLEASEMIYEQYTGLNDADYEIAANALLDETSDLKGQTKALCSLDIWQTLMKKHLENHIAELKEPLFTKLSDSRFDSEQDYLELSKNLKEQIERDESQLIYHATFDLLKNKRP
jgi:Leucine-rich repeat (LRR) protein/ankyrin repeat protein